MPRLSKKARREWNFFISPRQADAPTMTFVVNAVMLANKVSRRLLFFVLNTSLKEVLKTHLTAINLPIQAKPKNDT